MNLSKSANTATGTYVYSHYVHSLDYNLLAINNSFNLFVTVGEDRLNHPPYFKGEYEYVQGD
jgi:hypothetical protein